MTAAHPQALYGIFRQEDIDAAVMAERERCASIAANAEKSYLSAVDTVAKHESWQWAMNEMTDAVNETFFSAVRGLLIASKIREGQ